MNLTSNLFYHIYDQILKESNKSPRITGEYWITSDGSAEFADGDQGDKTHSMVISEHVIQKCFDVISYDNNSEYIQDEWETFLDFVAKEHIEDSLGEFDNRQWELYKSENPKLDTSNIAFNVLLSKGITEQELSIANNIGSDNISYGLYNLNWKRVHNNNIETKFPLTIDDLKQIHKGIEDIVEQESLWDIYEDWDTNLYLNIETVSEENGRKYYGDVPYSVIADGNLAYFLRNG